MRTLERITVTGYKSIKELRDFELGDLNVLIGANGAGKSNFLSVFKLLESLANERLQLFVGVNGGIDFLLHFGRKLTNELFISLDLRHSSQDEGYGYDINLVPTIDNRLKFSREEVMYRRGKRTRAMNLGGTPQHYGAGHDETKLPTISPQNDIWSPLTLETLKGWKLFHFQDTTPEARLKQNADIYDNHEFKSDARNIAAFLYLLKNHHQLFYRRILQTIQLAAPFFGDFILDPMPENPQRIRLRWRHKNIEDDFDISQLSDGTLRFICLATLLLQPNPPSLIIIDEPELGLHPYAINLLAGMLRSVSTQTQIIISTQSVSLVNEFQPENIIVVDRENDESTFTRLNAEELSDWLEEYGLGELWEKNVIGGRP